MQLARELCMKFPAVLRDKLLNREIELPDDTQTDYQRIFVYRAVARKENDNSEITPEDFKSYFQLKKKPKNPRGCKRDIAKDPHYYGVSSFLKREIVEQKMKFPNPNKKMAEGYVYKEGGPQETNLRDHQVCWWLYKDADVSEFRLREEGQNG